MNAVPAWRTKFAHWLGCIGHNHVLSFHSIWLPHLSGYAVTLYLVGEPRHHQASMLGQSHSLSFLFVSSNILQLHFMCVVLCFCATPESFSTPASFLS